MSDTEVRITLRLPEKLRDRLQTASNLNNRSMNGEIVERLQYTFGGVDEDLGRLHSEKHALEEEIARLKMQLEEEQKNSARSAADWEEWAIRQFSDENTLYILLDANGHPQSWDEIVTHLQAISDAGGINVQRIEAGVFDAPRERNDKRFDQWMKLREYYRAKRRSQT